MPDKQFAFFLDVFPDLSDVLVVPYIYKNYAHSSTQFPLA